MPPPPGVGLRIDRSAAIRPMRPTAGTSTFRRTACIRQVVGNGLCSARWAVAADAPQAAARLVGYFPKRIHSSRWWHVLAFQECSVFCVTRDGGDPVMLEYLQTLFKHAAWADARVLAMLRSETSEEDAPDAFRIVAHLLAAERVWLLRLRGEDSTAMPIWPELSLQDMADLSDENRDEY